jgi:type IV pilus assembly protein PilC
MATATATKVTQGVRLRMGRPRPQRQAGARRNPGRGENQVQAALRRQGVSPTKIKKRRMRSGQRIKPKDIAIFTASWPP